MASPSLAAFSFTTTTVDASWSAEDTSAMELKRICARRQDKFSGRDKDVENNPIRTYMQGSKCYSWEPRSNAWTEDSELTEDRWEHLLVGVSVPA